MLTDLGIFWVLLWLFSELGCVQAFATQIALILTLIVVFVLLLLSFDLDLLALFILNTYASAFLAITLISMQFVSFWGAVRQRALALGGGNAPSLLWFGCVLIFVVFSLAHLLGVAGWTGSFLWQDLSTLLVVSSSFQQQCIFLHWFFFNTFVVETVGINLYLFLGLALVIFFLTIRWLLGVSCTELTGFSRAPESRHRLRILFFMRRATRRSAASRLRFRFALKCYQN